MTIGAPNDMKIGALLVVYMYIGTNGFGFVFLFGPLRISQRIIDKRQVWNCMMTYMHVSACMPFNY